MCNPGRAAANAATDARAAEDARQQRTTEAIGRVNDTFGAFDQSFYDKRAQDFTDYATPEMNRQYGDARRDLVFALSRAGLTNSSVAATRLADLERDYGTRKQEVVDQARGYSQQARADVEQARSNLIGQAQATADSSVAANSALNEANRLRVAPSFSPIGMLFANTAAGIGAARNANDAEAIRAASGGTRLFQNTNSSYTVNR